MPKLEKTTTQLSAKKLESPTSLTEFAPLSPEIKSQTSFSFSKLFSKSKGKEEEHPSSDDASRVNSDEQGRLPLASHLHSYSTTDCDNISQGPVFQSCDESDVSKENSNVVQNRSMASVLRRIINIVDKKNLALQNYKDSDFKQYWMPDSNCKECYECGDKFTTFRRRHHCRVCGQIFCRRCCNQGIPGNVIGYTGDLRVCTYCFRMVLSCVQSLDSSCEVSSDLQAFHDNLQLKLNALNDHTDGTISPENVKLSIRRKSSVMGFREEDIAKAKPHSRSGLSDFCSNAEYSGAVSLHPDRTTYQDSETLKEIWTQLKHPVNGINFQNHRHQLRTYVKCVIGSEVVDWLINQNKASSRSHAIIIGQALLDAKFLESLLFPEQHFIDGYVLYRIREIDEFGNAELPPLVDSTTTESQESMEPLWVKEIQPVDSATSEDGSTDETRLPSNTDGAENSAMRSRLSSSTSMFYLNLDLKESRVSVSRPNRNHSQQNFPVELTDKGNNLLPNEKFVSDEILSESTVHPNFKNCNENMKDPFAESVLRVFTADQLESSLSEQLVSPQGWHSTQQLREDNGEKTAFERLNQAYNIHEQTLLCQLLSSESLSLCWCDIILPIVHTVIDTVHPDIKNDSDDMDIRQYVQFKKIPGGSKSECIIVNGVVCSKTVAHRKMEQNIFNPTLLLLSSPIAYQRVENKLSSLDPIIMQEFEYLKNTIGKLTVYKPDILLVEKTVSRLAQEMLLELGITVVLNVKPSVMERVARCTQAAIVSTVDAHLGRPQLGTSYHFKVKTYSVPGGKTKTLMFFDGCPTNLGCSILLRGGSSSELKKVKQIIQFMIYVAYNWQLERSFLMDEFALPSPSQQEQLLISDDIVENKLKFLQANSDCFPVEITKCEKDAKELASAESYSNESIISSNLVSSVKNTSNNAQKSEKYKSKYDESSKKLETKCIDDFSDPLHSYLRLDDLMFSDDNLQVASLPVFNTFPKVLDDVILCSSLNIKEKLPFLETETGKICELRKFFPDEIYWSEQFSKDGDSKTQHPTQIEFEEETEFSGIFINQKNVEILECHKFTAHKFTDIWNKSLDIYSLLSDFRARGGTIKYLCPHECTVKEKERKHLPNIHISEDKEQISKSNEVQTNTGLCWEKKVDALNPYNHQNLAVLFCSYSCTSNNAPNFCVNPWVVKMDFYGCNDITLGGFLERYCFRSTYVCPSSTCDTPMTEHVRKFVHDSGCVHILLHELNTNVQATENNILMWSWCHKCKQASPVVSVSQDTWSLSFAKYLELRFYASSYGRRGSTEHCNHSLHHDHYQYFAHKQLVAIFKYTPILVWEVVLPPFVIAIQDQAIPVASVVEQIKYLAIRGYGVYSNVLEKLFALKDEYEGTKCEDIIIDMVSTQKHEMAMFREKIEDIQLRLTSPTLENMQVSAAQGMQNSESICNFMWKIADQVILLKHQIAEAVQMWNIRIQEFVASSKKEEKLPSKLTQQTSILLENDETLNHALHKSPPKDEAEGTTEKLESEMEVFKPLQFNSNFREENSLENEESENLCKTSYANDTCKDKKNPTNKTLLHLLQMNRQLEKLSWIDRSLSWESISENCREPLDIRNYSRLVKAFSEPKNLAYVSTEPLVSKETEEVDKSSDSSAESSYTYGVSPGIYAGLMVPEPQDSETYVVCHKDHYSQSQYMGCTAKGHERSKSDGDEMLTDKFLITLQEKQVTEEAMKQDKKERTVKTLLSQLLSSTSVSPIQNPFPPSEHLFLPKAEKVPVIVYDDEPGSIIAYTLASTDYEQQLQELKINISAALNTLQRDSQSSSPCFKRRQNSKVQTGSNSGPESPQAPNEGSPNSAKKPGMLSFFRSYERGLMRQRVPGGSQGFDAVHYSVSRTERDSFEGDSADLMDLALCSSQEADKGGLRVGNKITNFHIEIQFSDSNARFYCRVYFAEQFRKLRCLVFSEGEERYIRSLSRCIPWMARGGKSGSTFCKTHDDRFILKQMPKLELQSFLDLAPSYFQYLNKACLEQKPTVLAKIVGVYRIGYKNTVTNTAVKMDLLVMENLFYERNIVQKYDLKGSVRNRLVNTNGQQEDDIVLLDENLLKVTCDCPLYMRPHSKTVLTLAISNDTQFLSSQSVMDYSLLVGLDDEKKELVVGIIDYIRTFTWDKKVEMLVKSSGILGGHGKMPTVVSPELYRVRFCEAMDGYFLWVPDRWTGLGKGVDC